MKIVERCPVTGRVRSVDYRPPRSLWFAWVAAAGIWIAILVAVACLAIIPRIARAAEVETCFVPGQDCEGVVVREITHARKEILVQEYEFTSWPIATALVNAYKAGVAVKVVFDRAGGHTQQARLLEDNGVPICIDPISGIAHNKVFVVDRKITVTGSMNATYSGAHRNVENIVVIDDKATAEKFAVNFEGRHLLCR